MSDDKIKVKDLATELSLNSKDIVTAAKELNITAAKVANSSLSEQEASRLRKHFAGDDGKREDVIVRRRPRNSSKTEAEPALSEEKKETSAEKPSELTETVEVPAAEQKDHVVPTPSVVQVKDEPKPASTGARIVKRAGEVPVVEEKPEPVINVASVVSSVVQEVPEAAKKPAPAAPVKAEEPESKKGGARIVRPAGAAFSAEPERTADGSAVSSVPVMSAHPKEEENATSTGSFAETSPANAVEPSSTGARIISRPDPREAKARVVQPAATRPGPSAGRPGGGYQQQQPRPGYQQQQPRPGGYQQQQPRPGGGNYGGGYRSSGAPAPSPADKPATTPGRMFQAYMPTEDSEQGRKKRQKGRRTVDFGGGPNRGGAEDTGWSKASNRRKGRKQHDAPKGGTQPIKAVKRKIKVEEFIRVSDFAHQMGMKSGEIIKILFTLGVMATINQSLDIETATLVAIEFGYEIEKVGFSEGEILDAQHGEDSPEDLLPRPPVVTIMGHVDHGKTSLLDAIRKASVVSGEAGGITQHIGAYHVATKKGNIVFLDTPGHEAFTAMRARGAEVTDIVVLVVAADDGVMEQTREAINHARAAGVPIMVAVNKIDKPAAEPDRVKRELSENGLVAEDWGGDTVFCYLSAKTGVGVDEMLEMLALQAEILELKANPNRPAAGHVIEAKLDKGRGSLGTVLIQQGTLRLGDTFVSGVHAGRVRAMFNDQGKKIKEATPSMPVEVQGFEGVPEAGEEFFVLVDDKTARRIADVRALKQRERDLAKETKVTLETFLASKPSDVEAVVLNLVIKADVQGSLEAIIDAMHKLSTEKVRINIIHGGAGAISESDILLAAASNAIIIGFNVRPTGKSKDLAEHEKVDMRFYDIIYKLVDEIKSAMTGMLAPVTKEVVLGSVEVREVFTVPKIGAIAGCHVQDGKVVRNCSVRLLRDGVVVYTGKLGSLRRFKDDVREVTKGYECGIGLENYNDIKQGDVIEAFEIVEEAARL